MTIPMPTVTAHKSTRELGGSVTIRDEKGNPLCLDPDTGELLECAQADSETKSNKHPAQNTTAGDGELCPKTTRECLESARGEEWKKSIDKEYFGLIDMGAIIPDLTWGDFTKIHIAPLV